MPNALTLLRAGSRWIAILLLVSPTCRSAKAQPDPPRGVTIHVTNWKGTPIEGIFVGVSPAGDASKTTRPLTTKDMTDANGNITIPGLHDDGAYNVEVVGEGYLFWESFRETYDANHRYWEVSLPRRASLTFHLQGSDGQPVQAPECVVDYICYARPTDKNSTCGFLGAEDTNGKGLLQVDDLVPGIYRSVNLYVPNWGYAMLKEPIDLATTFNRELTVKLSPGGDLRVRVLETTASLASIQAGTVSQDQCRPIRHACLALTNKGSAFFDSRRSFLVDETGERNYASIAPGNYTVELCGMPADAVIGSLQQTAEVRAGAKSELTFYVKEHEAPSLTLSFVTPQGTPLSGRQVLLTASWNEKWAASNAGQWPALLPQFLNFNTELPNLDATKHSTPLPLQTDTNGTIVLYPMPVGHWQVMALAFNPRGFRKTIEVDIPETKTATVVVTPAAAH